MLFLTRYLGVVIGDKIPRDDQHWKMYICLRQIVDILMSPRIANTYITTLRQLIEDLNSTYLNFYKALKSKFHFLIHYPTIMDIFGPCVHYWTMRYESRHRDVKANAVASNCNVNLLKSIAIKQALQMTKTFDTFENKLDISFDPDNIANNGTYNHVTVNGSEYRVGCFIVISVYEPDIQFGKIIKIEKLSSTDQSRDQIESLVQFTVLIYEEVYFDDHFMLYVIASTKKIVTLKYSNIPSMPPVAALKKGEHY